MRKDEEEKERIVKERTEEEEESIGRKGRREDGKNENRIWKRRV